MTTVRQNPSCVLPDEAIEAILVHLPIRDAVRTSVLSSNWRLNCQTMSKLVFNDECLPPSSYLDDLMNKRVHIIDSVLSLHVGPVQRFELSTVLPGCSNVNRWITFLSRNHIKEIILNFKCREKYLVPSCLFSCNALTHLELVFCEFKVPSSFQHFTRLTTLILRAVKVLGGRLEDLISGCPSLRVLNIDMIQGPSHLNINLPSLCEIMIIQDGLAISLGNTPYLLKATFDYSNFGGDGEEIKTVKFLDSMPNIQKLELNCLPIMGFHSYGRGLPRIPDRYESLKSLYIHVEFAVKREPMAALCLIRSLPNLEVLNIQVIHWEDVIDFTTYTWNPEDCDLTFNHLKRFKMANMIGTELELYLLKCVLTSAPLLETITISIDHEKQFIGDSAIFKDLMRHPRASTRAQIIYTEDLILTLE